MLFSVGSGVKVGIAEGIGVAVGLGFGEGFMVGNSVHVTKGVGIGVDSSGVVAKISIPSVANGVEPGVAG
ncbi:hypothetical protein SDC9_203802 [bioreactor metagenome]|uniref:Uncharacterized protein n=1 Tax=bioreactor metagenome TaxID=1076179 RepID=A0A645IY53_9ZZZZ